MVAFARPALGCAHTVGFTDVFIARDGPPQQQLLTESIFGLLLFMFLYADNNNIRTALYYYAYCIIRLSNFNDARRF